MLTITEVARLEESNALMRELPFVVADLLGIFAGLCCGPFAVLLVVFEEHDSRHAGRELHDGRIALAALGTLDQLVDLSAIGLGRCGVGRSQLLHHRLNFRRWILDMGKDARYTIGHNSLHGWPHSGAVEGTQGPVGHDAPLALASTASGASRAEPNTGGNPASGAGILPVL